MNKRITASFPLNVAEEHRYLYAPYLSYELCKCKVKRLKDVFITFTGFCVNSRGLIKECHHDFPQQYNNYLKEVAFYYYRAEEKPERLITLNSDDCYLVIHHPWFNYYHWIVESIFRLWMVRRQLNQLILILPEFYERANFIMESLEPFHVKKIYFIPDGNSLMVKNICLPQIKPICDAYNARQLQQVSNFYKNYVKFEKKISVEKYERLYISRELSTRRKIINEDEVQTVLYKYNFKIFKPENFSFLEQVAIFSDIKYLVGAHGSGLTNILFMNKGTSVLELHKDKTNELDHPSPVFWYMAEALNIKYFHQLCQNHGKEDYFEGDYIVDANLLERNLIKMIS